MTIPCLAIEGFVEVLLGGFGEGLGKGGFLLLEFLKGLVDVEIVHLNTVKCEYVLSQRAQRVNTRSAKFFCASLQGFAKQSRCEVRFVLRYDASSFWIASSRSLLAMTHILRGGPREG